MGVAGLEYKTFFMDTEACISYSFYMFQNIITLMFFQTFNNVKNIF